MRVTSLTHGVDLGRRRVDVDGRLSARSLFHPAIVGRSTRPRRQPAGSAVPVAVRRELEHLLERRAVRDAERVGDQARGEAGAPGGAAPRAGIGALRGRELRGDLVDRRPQRRAARGEVALAAVAQVELPVHRLAEQRAQVLVDVRLAREAAEPADRVEVAGEVAELRAASPRRRPGSTARS